MAGEGGGDFSFRKVKGSAQAVLLLSPMAEKEVAAGLAGGQSFDNAPIAALNEPPILIGLTQSGKCYSLPIVFKLEGPWQDLAVVGPTCIVEEV